MSVYPNINEFKEIRVAIIKSTLNNHNWQRCSDSDFLDEAELQGHTFSLEGFTKFLKSGGYQELSNSCHGSEFIFIRFINIYQDSETQEIYCEDVELGDAGYARTY